MIVTAACNAWLPLAGEVTPANVADNERTLVLIETFPPGLHFLLGDQNYLDEALRHQYQGRGCTFVTLFTGKNNPYPITITGLKYVKSCTKPVLLQLKISMNISRLFLMFTVRSHKKLAATQRFVLGVVFVYHSAILYSFLHNLDLRVGLEVLLKAA